MLIKRISVYFVTVLVSVGVLVAPANAGAEKLPAGISVEAWWTRPVFPVFSADAGPKLCFSGHVQDVGWQPVDCNDDGDWAQAGSDEAHKRLEAILIVAYNTGGRTCAQAHSQNIGWGAFVCQDDAREFAVGTTGQSRPMEAFKFGNTVRSTCNNAYGPAYGWQRYDCVGADQYRQAGTVGQSLRMEAATATIL